MCTEIHSIWVHRESEVSISTDKVMGTTYITWQGCTHVFDRKSFFLRIMLMRFPDTYRFLTLTTHFDRCNVVVTEVIRISRDKMIVYKICCRRGASGTLNVLVLFAVFSLMRKTNVFPLFLCDWMVECTIQLLTQNFKFSPARFFRDKLTYFNLF